MNSVIFNKLERLKEEIKYLSDNRQDFMAGLDHSRETRMIVERSVYLCCEIALDIADLLLVGAKHPKPATYSDSVYKLGDYGIIPKQFAHKFVYIAGLRNFLAHDYQKSTLPELLRFLRQGLQDMNEFVVHVEGHILS